MSEMKHVSEVLSEIFREMQVVQTKNWKKFIVETRQRQRTLNKVCKDDEKILESVWHGPNDIDNDEAEH